MEEIVRTRGVIDNSLIKFDIIAREMLKGAELMDYVIKIKDLYN